MKDQKYGLNVLTQLLQFSDDHANDAAWIRDAVDQYMLDKSKVTIESLSEDEVNDLVEIIKLRFIDLGIELPDYMNTETDSSVEGKGEEDKIAKLESELLTANRKLDVAKQFMKEMDTKLSKLESVNADDLVLLLAEYESIGSPEDLMKMISDNSSLQEKLDSLMTQIENPQGTEAQPGTEGTQEAGQETTENAAPAAETSITETATGTEPGSEGEATTAVENTSTEEKSTTDAADPKNSDTDKSVVSEKSEGEQMQTQETEVDKVAEAAADQAELLKRYQELGTPEELAELVEKTSKVVDANAELTEKVESASELLARYESIGEPEELEKLVEDFGQIKVEAEADRICGELGIPKEKVVAAIDKLGTIEAAESLLRDLFPVKAATESEETAEQKNETAGDEGTVEKENQPTSGEGPELLDKTEGERGTIIAGRERPKHESAQVAAHATRMDNLRRICGA